ncbi:MAG: hypothetical protein ACTSRG_25015 [Candidatus Helarchaeota archaeon]
MATLIKICGSSRSGSTMLDLMLGNASDAFSCGEVSAWFRPWRSHHFKLKCRCGKNPCPIWDDMSKLPESKFHKAVIDLQKVNFVIDSSKELCWVLDSQNWAVKNGINVFNILIWKNPINLAYSYWKRGYNINIWRSNFIGYYDKFIKMCLPFRSVYFNDLVSNPKNKLIDICTAVGMSYFEGKERFWEKQHHHLFGSYGIYKQVLNGKSKIKEFDEFPPEFMKHIDELSQQIAYDRKVKAIIDVLKINDISSSPFTQEEQFYLSKKPYPYWYYIFRIRNLFRRYFHDKSVVVK